MMFVSIDLWQMSGLEAFTWLQISSFTYHAFDRLRPVSTVTEVRSTPGASEECWPLPP